MNPTISNVTWFYTAGSNTSLAGVVRFVSLISAWRVNRTFIVSMLNPVIPAPHQFQLPFSPLPVIFSIENFKITQMTISVKYKCWRDAFTGTWCLVAKLVRSTFSCASEFHTVHLYIHFLHTWYEDALYVVKCKLNREDFSIRTD